MASKTVGFIGLGQMGLGVACMVLRVGWAWQNAINHHKMVPTMAR